MKRSAQLVGSLALAGLLSALNAEALTLGRLKVLSALGQPLVAEIEVPDITPDEAGSLRVGVAGADAFKSAGLEYNSAVTSLTIAGKRRSDGRALLELRSTSPITEPFLDLVLEITWATGRMVRDYTLLLDPQANQAMPVLVPTPTLPIQSVMPIRASTLPAAQSSVSAAGAIAASTAENGTHFSTRSPAAPAAPAVSVGSSNRFSTRTGVKLTASTKRGTKLSEKSGNKQTVQRGDTAAAIAAANKPEGVSLDQMLVAMLRTNPDAFVAGNVNRLRTGALLEMPSAQDANTVAKAEARDSIQVQSRDFNDYRRKLAAIAPGVSVESPARQASGKVIAKVDEKKSSTVAPDRLTLTKPMPAGGANAAPEDKIAKERTASDATARSAELQKNITDLGKITTGSAVPSSGTPATVMPVANASDPAALALPLAPVAPVASAPVDAVSAPVAVSAPAISGKKQGSFLDQIITHPLALPVGGGLLGLLGLGALWGIRRRRSEANSTAPQNSMSFPVTRQPSDTVFGALGANRIDTQESAASSTMVYPPSQLSSATGDVDPIAEADVYLAYNRDVQAEEILKEAKLNMPNRTDVHVKLMEIYVKRRDNEAFDAVALELHRHTDGAGSDWAKARDLAREIGSTHALFNVSASAFAASEAHTPASAYNNNSLSFAPSSHSVQFQSATASPASAPTAAPAAGTGLIDFDLSSLTLELPQNNNLSFTAKTEDPKLALAEEYLSIGDKAGARALIQDVMTHGDPSSLAAAQLMLSRIG